MDSYQGKVVVITGSGSGIGFALAKSFGAEGARLVVSDRDASRTEDAMQALRGEGFDVFGQACDVTDRAQVEALAADTRSHYGNVDVLVNNAGIGAQPTPLLDLDLDDFRRVMDVNLYGVLNGIQVFGRLFREQGTPCAIYNVGSENSIYPCVPSSHAYVSSKHSVLAVTELLAEEVPEFFEVALILPGLVETAMTAGLFKGMAAEDFAATIIAQLKAGQFYAVSHAYNRVRLDERHARIASAYDAYAPRYDGDDEYDIRILIEKMMG